jgi:Arc/MetJ-type ribon-helix-helix transcriptional regulator
LNGLGRDQDESAKYASVSLPIAIAVEIDKLILKLGYWPSRGAFVREACLEKIREEWRRLEELRYREDRARFRASRGELGPGDLKGNSPRKSRKGNQSQGQ